jgi:hypothetical protein
VARIDRGPKVVGEGIADVSFKPRKGLLPEDFLSTIGSVVGEEISVDVGVQGRQMSVIAIYRQLFSSGNKSLTADP